MHRNKNSFSRPFQGGQVYPKHSFNVPAKSSRNVAGLDNTSGRRLDRALVERMLRWEFWRRTIPTLPSHRKFVAASIPTLGGSCQSLARNRAATCIENVHRKGKTKRSKIF